MRPCVSSPIATHTAGRNTEEATAGPAESCLQGPTKDQASAVSSIAARLAKHTLHPRALRQHRQWEEGVSNKDCSCLPSSVRKCKYRPPRNTHTQGQPHFRTLHWTSGSYTRCCRNSASKQLSFTKLCLDTGVLRLLKPQAHYTSVIFKL